MLISYNASPEKENFVKNVLPTAPFVHTRVLEPMFAVFHDALVDALYLEIEVYKQYPRDVSRIDVSKFNPTNPGRCFMGLGFFSNSATLMDRDLEVYRRRIGKINHSTWGDVTLLEIWAGDHYESHTKMVTDVFKYCLGKRKECPVLSFHYNPFIPHKDKSVTPTKANKEQALGEFIEEYQVLRLASGLERVRNVDPIVLEEFEKEWKNKYGDKLLD